MRWIAIVLMAFLASCAAPLPTYPPMEPDAAIQVMRERDGLVKTVQSSCEVTLRDKEGSSVSFDAAIVAAWPDRLRLRAWKFGSPAFDVTFTPEGLWVFMPEEARRRAGGKAESFGVTAEQFGKVWKLMGPRAMEDTREVERRPDSAASFTVARAFGDQGGKLEFDIDRATLTVGTCRFIDGDGVVRQTLTMDRYRVVKLGEATIVWPMRIAAEGEGGRIVVRLRGPEFNEEPTEEAFVPPRRATKQP